MNIAVIDSSKRVCELIDWDRDAAARNAIDRARRENPHADDDEIEEIASEYPSARLERPEADRMVLITDEQARQVRVGWTFDRGYFYPPGPAEGG